MTPKPPAPGRVRNIAYPSVGSTVLTNGLTVLTVRDERLPRISVRLGLPAGRVGNPDDNLLLMQMAVALLQEGTKSRTSTEIAEFMDRWAIQYDTDVSMENTTLSVGVLDDHVEHALELLSEMVLEPAFAEDEIERLRTRWRSNIIAMRSQPEYLANERLFAGLYSGHPYGKMQTPLPHLEAVRRGQLQDVHRRWFVPEGAFLVFAGSVDEDRATGLAERFFGSWEPEAAPVVEYPPLEAIERRKVLMVARPHSAQARVLIAARTIPKTHPRFVELKVANQVLGGGANSRLFMNLRDGKGYTYGAYSQLKVLREDGLVVAGANVRSDACGKAIQEIFKEFDSMRRTAPAEDDLSRSQSELTGAFIRRMETASSVGGLELTRRLLGISAEYYQQYIPHVRSVSAQDVRDISQAYLDPARTLVVVVGDPAVMEGSFEEVGELTRFDTDGNPVD